MGNATGRLITQKNGDVLVVSFMDSQIRNQALVDRIGKELVSLVADRFQPKIVLSFEGVNYLSSSMLGKLVAAHKRVAEGKGKMCLSCIRPVIREVFEITRLDKVFKIYPDASAAVQALQRP